MTSRLHLAASIAVASLALAGCGGDEEPATFENDGFPITFEYPGDWEESEDVSIDQELGGQADETIAIGIDDANGIILQRFTLAMEVTEENLDLAEMEFEGLLQSIDPDVDAEQSEVAGYPALTIDGIALTEPEDGESRFTILFDGDQEYLLNCQSTPEEREAIEAGCDMAVESIEAGGER